MSAINSQNGREIAKIMHNAAEKFDWVEQKGAKLIRFFYEKVVYFNV